MINPISIALLTAGIRPDPLGEKNIGVKVPAIATTQSNGLVDTDFGALRSRKKLAANVSTTTNKSNEMSPVAINAIRCLYAKVPHSALSKIPLIKLKTRESIKLETILGRTYSPNRSIIVAFLERRGI